MKTLRDLVVDMLRAGQAVAYVCRVTNVPRGTVMRVGGQEGLVYRPGLDSFVTAMPDRTEQDMLALLRRGERARSVKARAAAQRVRSAVVQLQHELELEAAELAYREAPHGRVREWARKNDVTVTARGPVPRSTYVAWVNAGQP